MAIVNTLKPVLDLPVWEWARFQPAASAAGTCMCTSDDGSDRYIYYLNTTFWRYDTYTDGWQQLMTPPGAIVTTAALKYSEYGGFRGNCLGATSSTMTIPGLRGSLLQGYKIRIISGTGMGQERTIASITDAVTLDQGVVTGASTTAITDSTKRWKTNQWVGYQVRITLNSGVTQVRKVLYSDGTNLYLQDANYQQLEPWCNIALTTTTAGAGVTGTHYQIESSTITTDTNWTVTPDLSSSFVILSGGIWLMTSNGSAPWTNWQYYDVASDTWTYKTNLGGFKSGALVTDWAFERTGEVGGLFLSGTATSGTARTLVDTTKTLTAEAPEGHNKVDFLPNHGTPQLCYAS